MEDQGRHWPSIGKLLRHDNWLLSHMIEKHQSKCKQQPSTETIVIIYNF